MYETYTYSKLELEEERRVLEYLITMALSNKKHVIYALYLKMICNYDYYIIEKKTGVTKSYLRSKMNMIKDVSHVRSYIVIERVLRKYIKELMSIVPIAIRENGVYRCVLCMKTIRNEPECHIRYCHKDFINSILNRIVIVQE